jgi:hypothetical protein
MMVWKGYGVAKVVEENLAWQDPDLMVRKENVEPKEEKVIQWNPG